MIKEYRKWLQETDFNYNRFSLLADQLEIFLLENRLINEDFTKEVASKFEDVLSKCDEIDYEDDATATAYGILHFLNRYHRFQLNFVKLIEHSYFPIRNYEMNVLDVGTGPGPALFAISDAYKSLKIFAQERSIKRLDNIEFRSDYVERSRGFRQWLHHLTEYANFNSGSEINWKIPYHHGTFGDFTGINFNEISGYWTINRYGDYTFKNKTIKHRFNLIIFSNFLTRMDQVESISEELKNCVRYLRNQGKLIVVGGVGSQYPKLYDKVDDIITNENYNNHRFSRRKMPPKNQVYEAPSKTRRFLSSQG